MQAEMVPASSAADSNGNACSNQRRGANELQRAARAQLLGGKTAIAKSLAARRDSVGHSNICVETSPQPPCSTAAHGQGQAIAPRAPTMSTSPEREAAHDDLFAQACEELARRSRPSQQDRDVRVRAMRDMEH
jgi:hypothetical protein